MRTEGCGVYEFGAETRPDLALCRVMASGPTEARLKIHQSFQIVSNVCAGVMLAG